MSFANATKIEIANNKSFRSKTKIAQAYGLFLFAKSFTLDTIHLQTENKELADLYVFFASDMIGIEGTLTVKERKRQNKRFYVATVDDRADRERIFNFFGYDPMLPLLDITLLDTKEKIASFLSGVYMACGHINDPQNSYHLEFVFKNEEIAKIVGNLIECILVQPKIISRRGDYILYFKESEQIEDVFTLMGATKATMQIMDVKMLKELRNNVNRVTNCETANIERTVNAAYQQIEDIKFIFNKYGEDYLSGDLKEIAKIRLYNPDMSLQELSQESGVELSRSGIHYRLKKITDLAKHIRDSEYG
ncbi:MAG: DNA-binding protein WhiA [Oscillospiraceae bacterium]